MGDGDGEGPAHSGNSGLNIKNRGQSAAFPMCTEHKKAADALPAAVKARTQPESDQITATAG